MGKQNKYDTQHVNNLRRYHRRIDEIYASAATEAAAIGVTITNFKRERPLALVEYPITKDRVDRLLDKVHKDVESVIVGGVRQEWELSNAKNDELVRSNIRKLRSWEKGSKDDARSYEHLFRHNEKACEAFLARKEGGLNLSDRVWRYTSQFKDDIELGIDLGLRAGKSAEEMGRDLRQYLQQPDMLFRRVRDEHGQLHLSKRAAAYHPGAGVYRSSRMNALRLARTEPNIAYRAADHLRWQQLDFVVGIEIHLSNNHTLNGKPFCDICDDLQGRYPKDFKFTGWHPHCRCFATSILKTAEEMDEDAQNVLSGKEVKSESVNTVSDVPAAFKEWLANNEERLELASSIPYFIADNTKYTGVKPPTGSSEAVVGTKLGRTATKAAIKIYEDMSAPKLTPEVQQNTEQIAAMIGVKTPPIPMTFLAANDGQGNTSWGKGVEFAENCQIAVAVHEARLRGLNVTSLGYDRDEQSIPYTLAERPQEIWEHPKTHKTPTPTVLRGASFETLLLKLNIATKAVGRYHIGINMKYEGHIITAERLPDSRIILYDAQSGTFLKIEEYATSGVESFEVLKVDKLLLRGDLFKVVSRPL